MRHAVYSRNGSKIKVSFLERCSVIEIQKMLNQSIQSHVIMYDIMVWYHTTQHLIALGKSNVLSKNTEKEQINYPLVANLPTCCTHKHSAQICLQVVDMITSATVNIDKTNLIACISANGKFCASFKPNSDSEFGNGK